MNTFGKWLWAGWMKFAHIVGEVNQYLLLAIVYFVLIGLYALIAWPFRLFKRSHNSAWHEAGPGETLEELTRPF